MKAFIIHEDLSYGEVECKSDGSNLAALISAKYVAMVPGQYKLNSKNQPAVVVYVDDEGLLTGRRKNALATWVLSVLANDQYCRDMIKKSPVMGDCIITHNNDGRSLSVAQLNSLVGNCQGYFNLQKIVKTVDASQRKKAAKKFRALTTGKQLLELYTRSGDGQYKLKSNTLNKPIPCADDKSPILWIAGVTIRRLDDNQFELHTRTVYQKRHTLNFECTVDSDAKIACAGRFNAFGLGYRIMRDQAHIDEFILELCEESADRHLKWDVYESVPAEASASSIKKQRTQ